MYELETPALSVHHAKESENAASSKMPADSSSGAPPVDADPAQPEQKTEKKKREKNPKSESKKKSEKPSAANTKPKKTQTPTEYGKAKKEFFHQPLSFKMDQLPQNQIMVTGNPAQLVSSRICNYCYSLCRLPFRSCEIDGLVVYDFFNPSNGILLYFWSLIRVPRICFIVTTKYQTSPIRHRLQSDPAKAQTCFSDAQTWDGEALEGVGET